MLYSPTALFKKIKEEFYKDGKIVRDASKFLAENLEGFEDKVDELVVSIDSNKYNEVVAELAAFTLIKKELPALINNQYFAEIKNRNQSILSQFELGSPSKSTEASSVTQLTASQERAGSER